MIMGREVIRGLNLRHGQDFEWVYKLCIMVMSILALGKYDLNLIMCVCILG